MENTGQRESDLLSAGSGGSLRPSPVCSLHLSFAALYGVLFEKNKEAAFANYRLWEALGFVIAFGYGTVLCVNVKLYILLLILVLTMVAYGIVEYMEFKNSNRPQATEQTKPAEEGEMQTEM